MTTVWFRGPMLLAALAAAMLFPPHTAGAAAGSAWKRYAPLLAREDSLYWAGRFDACAGLLDSARDMARARGDAQLARIASVRDAYLRFAKRQPAADSAARGAIVSARAARDTATWCAALRLTAFMAGLRRDFVTQHGDGESLVRLAHRAGRTADEGWGWLSLGYADLESGHARPAVAHYRRARALCTRAGDPRGRMYGSAGIGRGLFELGLTDGARRAHLLALDDAQALHDARQQSETYANLGALEHEYGDPGQALFDYERAESLSRAIGLTERALAVERNLALLDLHEDRLDDADSMLMRLLPVTERSPDARLRANVFDQVGVLRRQQGRFSDAVTFGRRAVALADSLPPWGAVYVITDLAHTLGAMGREADALALLDARVLQLGPAVDAGLRGVLLSARAGFLLRMGRPREAIAQIQGLLGGGTSSGVLGYGQVQRRLMLARAYQAAGRPDSALAAYREAALLWERARGAMGVVDWREHYDDAAAEFAGTYAALLLDPARGGSDDARTREAFAALQRFRSRTILERVRGLQAQATPAFAPAGAATLQRDVLRDGELFIDVHAGRDTTVVFLVTRRDLKAYFAPSSRSLVPRLRRLRTLLGAPDADAREMLSGAEIALGKDLFGPADAALAGARSVILASGALAQYPLAALVPPGGSEGLGERLDVAQIPSAALLQVCRTRAAKRPDGGVPLFALARTRDEGGNQIAGAANEVRALSERYEGVVARVDPHLSVAQLSANDLLHATAIHFASHARAEFVQPWRSGLLVGDPARPDPYLRADAIARLRPLARLCVMSSCRTIGGRDRGGETLEGLAAAWLVAGVPTVIATQWDEDDRALAELMRRFYDRLARGEAASVALRGAQGEIRAMHEYAAPYFWQGVVLVGAPETRLALKRRGGRTS